MKVQNHNVVKDALRNENIIRVKSPDKHVKFLDEDGLTDSEKKYFLYQKGEKEKVSEMFEDKELFEKTVEQLPKQEKKPNNENQTEDNYFYPAAL